jgi:large subunit ribosomal protein L13
MSNYTKSTSTAEANDNREWFVVDLEGETLGRAAARIAHVLRGKHKPTFTPHIDDGDFVVVVNADKVHMTGNKLVQKHYWRHSGYVGGIKQLKKLKVYAGATHPHAAQQPKVLELGSMLSKGKA